MTMLLSLGIVKTDYTTEVSTHAIDTDDLESDAENNEAKMEKLLILSPVVTILYLSVLLGIVLLSIILSYRRNIGRLVMEEKRQIIIEMKKLDRPPSYTRIYFSEDPPEYRDVVMETNREETEDCMEDVELISL